MGALEEGGKVATATVESLKSQPLALALIVINLMFLAGGIWIMHDIADSVRAQQLRKDQLLAELAKDCIVVTPKSPEGK
jgi:hypothetical protein